MGKGGREGLTNKELRSIPAPDAYSVRDQYIKKQSPNFGFGSQKRDNSVDSNKYNVGPG